MGTAHGGHIRVAGYPVTKLAELVASFVPDLVLVEIRPEPFALGHYEDGPFEMGYVTLVARKLGIAVEGIDWFSSDDVPDPPGSAEGERIFEREFGDLARRADRADTFEILNSRGRALDSLNVENARARLGISDGLAWHQRQSWFHHRASEAIASTTRIASRRSLASPTVRSSRSISRRRECTSSTPRPCRS